MTGPPRPQIPPPKPLRISNSCAEWRIGSVTSHRIKSGPITPAALQRCCVENAVVQVQTPSLGKRWYELKRTELHLTCAKVQSIQPAVDGDGVNRVAPAIDGWSCIDCVWTKIEGVTFCHQVASKRSVPNHLPVSGVDGEQMIGASGYINKRFDALRPVACRPADRCLFAAGVALASAPLQPLAGPLCPAGRHSPHLSAGSQDRGLRLVSRYRPTIAVALPARALHLTSLLGCLREDSAAGVDFVVFRRRSAGACPIAPAGFVEGKTGHGPPPLAGLRYHQLLHLYCQHQHPQ